MIYTKENIQEFNDNFTGHDLFLKEISIDYETKTITVHTYIGPHTCIKLEFYDVICFHANFAEYWNTGYNIDCIFLAKDEKRLDEVMEGLNKAPGLSRYRCDKIDEYFTIDISVNSGDLIEISTNRLIVNKELLIELGLWYDRKELIKKRLAEKKDQH